MYWLAAALAINGDPSAPTIGDIVAFTTLQSRLFFPLGQLLNVQVEIAGSLALFDRIFEYLDLDPEIVDAPDAVTLEPAAVRGRVRLRRVSFRYPTAAVPSERALEAIAGGHTHETRSTPDEAVADAVVEPIAGEALQAGLPEEAPGAGRPTARRGCRARGGPPQPRPPARIATAGVPAVASAPPAAFALEEIAFEAEPGQLVALVGPSGSGKTTTTYLVPRLYDVDSGAVEIDGRRRPADRAGVARDARSAS